MILAGEEKQEGAREESGAMQQHKAQGGQVSWGKAAAYRRGQEVTKGRGLQGSNNHGGYWKGTPRTRERQQIHRAQCWRRNCRLWSSRLGEAQSHIANLSWGRTQPF